MIGVGEWGPLPYGSDGGGAAPASSGEDRAALTVLVSVSGIGPITLERLLVAFGSAPNVLAVAAAPNGARSLIAATADPEGLRRGMAAPVAAAIVDAAARRDAILEGIARLGLEVVFLGDAAYPSRLRAIELPPAALFVRGDAAILGAAHAVAVVGTRRPTDAGRRTANRIGAALARAEALVVSGLAIGIDGAAHAATLEAGGRTVAFIGSGHDRLFPAVHDRLAAAIVERGGAVVSEYPPDTEATKGTFPRRNRLISGAADAVVVVEAGARSGALLTASWALEQGRECFLVPGPIDAPMSAGCLGFLRDWPGVTRVVAGIPQLLDDLGLPGAAGLPARPADASRGVSSSVAAASPGAVLTARAPGDEAVGRAVLAGAATVDELVAVTTLTVPAVLRSLTRLEAAGLVQARAGRYLPAGSLAA